MTATYRNAAGISPQRAQFLAKALEPFSKVDEALPGRLTRFILDGEDAQVLGELKKMSAANTSSALGQQLYYQGVGVSDFKLDMKVFFEHVDPKKMDVYLRLTETMHALGTAWNLHFSHLQPLAGSRKLPFLVSLAHPGFDGYEGWPIDSGVTYTFLEQFLKAEGLDDAELLRTTLQGATSRWDRRPKFLAQMRGFDDSVARQSEIVRHAITQLKAEQRVHALEVLNKNSVDLKPFAKELVAAAIDSAKTVRAAALPLVKRIAPEAWPLVKEAAMNGKSDQRERAVQLLFDLMDPDASDFLLRLVETEKAPRVRELIDDLLKACDRNAPAPVVQVTAELPPLPPVELNTPLTPALKEACLRFFDKYNQEAAASQQLPHAHLHKDPIDLATVPDLLADLESMTRSSKRSKYRDIHGYRAQEELEPLVQHADLQIVQLLRLLVLSGLMSWDASDSPGDVMNYQAMGLLNRYHRSHSPRPSLRQLAHAFAALGGHPEVFAKAMVKAWGGSVFAGWEPADVAPYVMEYSQWFVRGFTGQGAAWDSWQARWRREGVIKLLKRIQVIPHEILEPLWSIALGPAKTDRAEAQQALELQSDREQRIIAALGNRAAEVRAVAAEWARRLQLRSTTTALHAAAKKEKNDLALDALLTALERLGESIEPYLCRDKLATEAEKALAKEPPAALAWFPFAQLPSLHWSDSGQEVPPAVVRYWLAQTCKLKSPAAGALLKRYVGLIKPAEREELGKFVFQAWLDQDLKRKYTDEEARQLARQQAPQLWQSYQSSLPWFQQHNHPVPAQYQQSQQQVEDSIFQGLQRECGSATDSKGILAIASACGGSHAALAAGKYLKEWYGLRAAQCKALLAMLAAMDGEPSAIQLLLSVANRFRTKGIREEAERLVKELAERKGWTIDELADRTIPSAGFGEDGELALNYGQRKFVARVNAKLDVVLTDPDGKTIKNLPDPRKDDDAEAAKEAKKLFSSAKKDLKKLVEQQSTRLYEAMCTERCWSFDDWKTYLMAHPIVKFLCQRLIWCARQGDKLLATFRPLDDGTLTGPADEEVGVPLGATIQLAHSLLVPPEVDAAWVQHLTDYEVEPLFGQIGRGGFAPTEEQKQATSIDDYKGHLIEAFKLRGAATKLGFTRGETGDGGWFHTYDKQFPGLGLTAVLEFSGNGLPEENRTVALIEFYFERKSQQEGFGMGRAGLSLGEIPQVLLAESLADLKLIAGGGTGYDPQWEKKVQY